MNSFQFAIIATGLDTEANGFADRFYEAGCDDALVAFQRGAIVVDFDWEAETFFDAIATAIENVRSAGATVTRVEPDNLVNLSDIAERTGLSRQAVALYASGRRGTNFPAPAACVTSDHPLYDWMDVAEWMTATGKLDQSAVEQARTIKRLNDDIAGMRAEGERELIAA